MGTQKNGGPDSVGQLGFTGSPTIELRTTLAARLRHCVLAASAISVAARSRGVGKLRHGSAMQDETSPTRPRLTPPPAKA